MKYCDQRVRAKCPDGKLCEPGAEFADGSECDKFNKKCLEKTPTIADHIRAMTDFELMRFLWKLDSQDLGDVIKFCGKSHVCDELGVDEITVAMCQRCLLTELQQPHESEWGSLSPTVDAVEVVRCRNCKYWAHGDCYRLELSRPDDFCSYGVVFREV